MIILWDHTIMFSECKGEQTMWVDMLPSWPETVANRPPTIKSLLPSLTPGLITIDVIHQSMECNQ